MSDGIKAEKNVSIPKAHSTRSPGTEALSALQVGESFIWPKDAKNPAQSAHAAALRAGVKVVTRKVDGGVRVWRVA